MPDQRVQEASHASAVTGGMPRSLAVEPILQHLFGRPEGDRIEFMRVELGIEFEWGCWLHDLVRDLVATGVLVRDVKRYNQYLNAGLCYYKLSVSTWLKLAQEEALCRDR